MTAVSQNEGARFDIKFDRNHKHDRIELSNSFLTSKWPSTSGYQTVIMNKNLAFGSIYKLTFKVIRGVDFKIGVTKDRSRLNSAFSDFNSGWAFYNYTAELRHESGGGGPKYGVKFEQNDQISMVVDTI